MAAISTVDDAKVVAVLELLRDLYSTSRIESDRGWFQEHGYIEAGKSKAIRKMVNTLCGEVRPHARGLVDAFGIPDALLAAPIAVS